MDGNGQGLLSASENLPSTGLQGKEPQDDGALRSEGKKEWRPRGQL